MKKILFITVYSFGCVFSLFVASSLLRDYRKEIKNVERANRTIVYGSLPASASLTLEGKASSEDGRIVMVRRLFERYNCPITSEAGTFIEVADTYKVDFAILPAIALHETLCGKNAPEGTLNPFGYGINSKQRFGYEGWGDSIREVGKAMAKYYFAKGLDTPKEIMVRYNPLSANRPDQSWLKGVCYFAERLGYENCLSN